MEFKTKYNIGDKVSSIYFDDADLKYYVSLDPKFIQDIRIDKENDKLVVRYRVSGGLTMSEEDLYPDFEQARVGALKRSINSINNRIAELRKDVESLEKVLATTGSLDPANSVDNQVKIDAVYYDEIVNTYKGYNYVVRLKRSGYRCGYVQVPDGDLFDEISENYYNWESDGPDIECHGGLSYCCNDNDWLEGDNWIGFDCFHVDDAYDLEAAKTIFTLSEDLLEFMTKYNTPDGIPRSKEYVESHCKRIIDQLIELSKEKEKING